MQKTPYDIIVFFIITSIIILIMAAFITTIVYLYRKKQIAWLKNMEEVKADYEKNILEAQLEIQEQTFDHISREIHDNISLNLTLAKLQLNTLDENNPVQQKEKIQSSLTLLGKSIEELSQLSHSLNAALISDQGLIKALDEETGKLNKSGLVNLDYSITGNPVFMDAQKELIVFRIVQEALNNILKHAGANKIKLNLYYNNDHINVFIEDNGAGFSLNGGNEKKSGSGLINMQTRAKLINGDCEIISGPGKGTVVKLVVPFENNEIENKIS